MRNGMSFSQDKNKKGALVSIPAFKKDIDKHILYNFALISKSIQYTVFSSLHKIKIF